MYYVLQEVQDKQFILPRPPHRPQPKEEVKEWESENFLLCFAYKIIAYNYNQFIFFII